MEENIITLRNALYRAIETENSTQSEVVLKISQELDLLILDFYKSKLLSLQMTAGQ